GGCVGRGLRQRFGFAWLRPFERDEARAIALDAGEVLVARGLIDAPLGSARGFQGFHGQTVGRLGAVTTAFADFRVYEGAQRRVGVGAALATPAFLGRAGLVVDEDGRALQLTQFTLDAIEFIAMVDGRVPVQVHPFVFIGDRKSVV